MPRRSPQREQTGSFWTRNSAQHASQIGTEESCGRGEPQREQSEGRRAQLAASRRLRSTRATARHAEVPDGGTSSVSEFRSLLKTHLAKGGGLANSLPLSLVYIYTRLQVSKQTGPSWNRRKLRANQRPFERATNNSAPPSTIPQMPRTG